jgi:hypothetical protein
MDHLAVFLPNRGFFGASLVVIPALLELRRRFPGLPLVGFSTSPAHGCFRNWGLIEEFHHYPKPLHAGLRAPVMRSFRGRAAVVVNMRPGSEWVQLWSWLVPAQERWAFRQGFGRLLARHHIVFDVTRYKAFNYLGLLPGDPGVREGDLLDGWPPAAVRLPTARRLVLLPSGSDDRKLWPLDGYEALARAWLDGMGDEVVVIAGPREQAVQAWFGRCGLGEVAGMRIEVGTPLFDQVATIRSAAAVVHNDCGPGHIAQLADRPRVVLFPEWGDPPEWFRTGPRARCLRAQAGQPIASIPTATVLAALREVTS